MLSLKMTLGKVQQIYGIESVFELKLNDFYSLTQDSVILNM